MSVSMENVTLVKEGGVKMNIKYKKCLQTLGCAVVIAYFTLLVYQTFRDTDIEVNIELNQFIYLECFLE